MNWYIIVGIVSAFLLGWGIGIWFGTSRGYAAAAEDYKQMAVQKTWSHYINNLKGAKHE